MAIVYPMNDMDFDADDVALYHATRTSGIFDNEDFACHVSGADNSVTVDPGLAWIRESRFVGRVVAEKNKYVIDMGVADDTYPRIDAVVLRYEAGVGANLVCKQGTAASNPKPPEVVQKGAVIELHLYHVRREAGAAVIPVNALTDVRGNPTYCGLMQDSVTPRDADITAEKLPVVPMNKGGTGAQNGSDGLNNLLAAGYMRLSPYQLMDNIPENLEEIPDGTLILIPIMALE